MELLYLLIGIIIGLVIGILFLKLKGGAPGFAELEKVKLQERNDNLSKNNLDLEQEKSKIETELNAANNRLAKAEEAFKNMNEKLETSRKEKEELQKQLMSEFENIANKILDEKSKKFTEQNKTNLDIILNPLKEKIKDFEDKVDKTYKAESTERNDLKGQIKLLLELNTKISEEANNLAMALKGDQKMQGNWGEVVLERVLERSGLVKGQEYETQVAFLNEEGRRMQPDVVVRLPDNKHVIIDSKVSLVAYEAFTSATTQELREKYTKEHIISFKKHITQLSDKGYQTSATFDTPDFVLLFVPIESSFSLAIQADQEIFNFAWERKIVIVSPSTLLATLKTISSIWKQERQTKNALEIAKQSGALYDKFVGFVEDLQKIGKSLRTANQSYEESMKKLSEGHGSLVNRVENIKKLGAKNTKSLDQSLVENPERE